MDILKIIFLMIKVISLYVKLNIYKRTAAKS